MNIEQNRMKKLDEQIYIICFSKPCHVNKIIKTLYPDQSKSISHLKGKDGKIQQLANKKWIHLIGPPNKLFKDARYFLRKNYYSDIKPLLDSIDKHLKLKQDELSILRNLLDTKEFRSLIKYKETCTTLQDIFNILIKCIEGFQIVKIHIEKKLPPKFKNMNESQMQEYYEKRKNLMIKVFSYTSKYALKNVEKYKITDTRIETPKKELKKYVRFAVMIFFTDYNLLIKLKKLPHPPEIHDVSQIIPSSLYEAVENYEKTGKLENEDCQ